MLKIISNNYQRWSGALKPESREVKGLGGAENRGSSGTKSSSASYLQGCGTAASGTEAIQEKVPENPRSIPELELFPLLLKGGVSFQFPLPFLVAVVASPLCSAALPVIACGILLLDL